MKEIAKHIGKIHESLVAMDMEIVENVAQMILDAHARGDRILTCGNGGSAATAMHFAGDLRSVGIDAWDLLSPVKVTQIGNDVGYNSVFWDQAQECFLIAFSCSGASGNIVNAAPDVLFTSNWGMVSDGAGVAIRVPSDKKDYETVEDVHLILCHAIKNQLRKDLM